MHRRGDLLNIMKNPKKLTRMQKEMLSKRLINAYKKENKSFILDDIYDEVSTYVVIEENADVFIVQKNDSIGTELNKFVFNK